MKPILITGSTGFIGQNILRLLLKKDYPVFTLDRIYNNNNLITKSYTWNQIEEIPFDEMFCVIHLTGKAHDVKNVGSSSDYFDINTELTKEIYSRFVKSKSKKFIHLSSVKAIADKVDKILNEDDQPQPVGPYGESKLLAEQYILNNISENQQTYILRPCMVHGPGNKGNLNLLYNFVEKGIPSPLGRFEKERSFLSIDNLLFVIDKLIKCDIPSGTYNVADDSTLSINDIVLLIGLSLEKKSKIWNTPVSIVNLIAKLGDIFPLPINSEKLNKLTESYIVSNIKIKQVLDISNFPMSADEGMLKTFKSFISK